MKPSIFIALAVKGFLMSATEAADCTVKPMVVPIRNVTFPNGVGANRGVRLLLGDQIEGLRISTILNNTRLRNVLDCPSDNATELIACAGASGSIYSTADDTFQSVESESDWNVTTIDRQPDDGSTTVVHGYDTANFTDAGVVIDEYPIEVWSNKESVNLSALALGPASSTLERLVTHELAPSSSWSLDFGSTSESHPRDGQLIIGGVNEARFSDSKKTEFDMWGAGTSVNCPLQVLVEDIVVTNEDGDHSLFPDADSKISACIDTVQNSFTLTQSMFEKFQKIGKHIDSDGLDFPPSVFPMDSEPLLGSMTIKLSNGYKSVIPHYELVNHQRGTNAQGKYAVLNSSRIAATVSAGASDLGDGVPIFGGVFLSQNYLHVDYSAQKFWLSPQVANGTKADKITTSCSTETPASTKSPSPDQGGNSNSNLGVKIGVPVAAAGLVAAGILAFFLWRRNKKSQASKTTDAEFSTPRPATSATVDPILHHGFAKSPMSGFTHLSDHPSELETYPMSPASLAPGHVVSPVQPPMELPAVRKVFELDSRAI